NAGEQGSPEPSDGGKVPEPPAHVSDQIETALDQLSDEHRESSIQQEENASLREEIRKLKAQCACAPAAKKSKKIVKKPSKKKKVVKSIKSGKKTKKADLKKTPAQKKKALNVQPQSPKRVIASVSAGLPTELPKKRLR
ncbi:MAG TPA: hypothetical protein VFV50_07820, partial [Bdellovibrionales bacterium]|nr:hypothetical protein [Bdellovibrionales bacterium]